jgi:hypothetical protein
MPTASANAAAVLTLTYSPVCSDGLSESGWLRKPPRCRSARLEVWEAGVAATAAEVERESEAEAEAEARERARRRRRRDGG